MMMAVRSSVPAAVWENSLVPAGLMEERRHFDIHSKAMIYAETF
jgi:hypothetical protein